MTNEQERIVAAMRLRHHEDADVRLLAEATIAARWIPVSERLPEVRRETRLIQGSGPVEFIPTWSAPCYGRMFLYDDCPPKWMPWNSVCVATEVVWWRPVLWLPDTVRMDHIFKCGANST